MLEFEITPPQSGKRIDKYLLNKFPNVPESLIFRSFRKKEIKINERWVDFKYSLKAGDILRIYPKFFEEKLNEIPGDLESLEEVMSHLNIVYEDENIFVIYKKAGVLSQANKPNSKDDLVTQVNKYLWLKYPDIYRDFKSGSINRLDRNTEGLILFGKNYKTLKMLNQAVKAGKVKKYYLSVLKGIIKKEKMLHHYLSKDRKYNTVMIYEYNEMRMPDMLECKSILRPLATFQDFTLVEFELITGRSHQLRAQAAYINHPIIGDMKYGDPEANDFFDKHYDLSSQYLTAYKMEFNQLLPPLNYLNRETFLVPKDSTLLSLTENIFGSLEDLKLI